MAVALARTELDWAGLDWGYIPPTAIIYRLDSPPSPPSPLVTIISVNSAHLTTVLYCLPAQPPQIIDISERETDYC